MPTLGGNDTLRGFREYRFRGPHAILGQAEYRWEIWSGLDARALLRCRQGRRPPRRPEFQGSGTRLRLRVPLQHRRRDRVPRGCRLRESRWQTSVHRFRRHFLGACIERASGWGIAAALAAHVGCGRIGARGRPRRASIRDDPMWSDDDRAFDASKVVPIEDTNGYDFIVNTFDDAGRAPRRARAERQHRRRSARLELVHQPDRPPRHDRRRRGQRSRSARDDLARRLGRVGRQGHRRAARVPDDGSGGAALPDRSGSAVESRAGERRRDHRDRFLSRHRLQHGRRLPGRRSIARRWSISERRHDSRSAERQAPRG